MAAARIVSEWKDYDNEARRLMDHALNESATVTDYINKIISIIWGLYHKCSMFWTPVAFQTCNSLKDGENHFTISDLQVCVNSHISRRQILLVHQLLEKLFFTLLFWVNVIFVDAEIKKI